MTRFVSALVCGTALVALLGGCGSVPRTGQASPAPSPTQTAIASPTPVATPSPTPVPTVSPSAGGQTVPLLAHLDCRLPIQFAVPNGSSGFLDLRTGQFISDPAAPDSASYSWAAHKWLPVRLEQVAPDGLHYAYVEQVSLKEGRVHVVDVTAGSDRVLLSGATWGVRAFGADGVYVDKEAYASSGNWGLWRVDPGTGATTQLLPESVANFSFGSGAAWTYDSLDNPTVVYRIDLTTGSRVEWFRKATRWTFYAGASDPTGEPLMMWQQDSSAASPAAELWSMSGPSKGTQLYSGSFWTLPFPPAVTDAHGLWFSAAGSKGALWLLSSDDTLVKVSSSAIRVAGACD